MSMKTPDDGYLLRLHGVSRTFSDPCVHALGAVDLDLHRGQAVSIVGPSGCGKSTLLRIIAGLDEPSTGSLSWSGAPLGPKVALMPQGLGLYDWNRVWENVALAAWIAGRPRAEAKREAVALLAEFGLDEFADAWPAQLSGGMRSRVAFLRTMLARPALMALDEPFGALDALTRVQLQHWLLIAAADRDLTLVLVTHDVDEAILLADRVLVMSPRPGRIIADLDVRLDDRTAVSVRDDPDYRRVRKAVQAALAGRQIV